MKNKIETNLRLDSLLLCDQKHTQELTNNIEQNKILTKKMQLNKNMKMCNKCVKKQYAF